MKKRITITLDEKIYDIFKKYCEERGMKISTKIQRIIEETLEKRD